MCKIKKLKFPLNVPIFSNYCYSNETCRVSLRQILSRQTINVGPVLTRLRVHWPNIVPYMVMHWANFPGLSGYIYNEGANLRNIH